MARVLEVVLLFLRLGATAFGGPAAHVALLHRECVERRRWISPERFLEMLSIASLIPGPTSTELVMHIGRERAGWPGLVAAGVAFIVPASLVVTLLAAIYTHGGDLPAMDGVLFAVQPVAIVIVLQALVALGRSTIRAVPMAMLVLAVGLLASAGIPEIRILLLAGVVHLLVGRASTAALVGVALCVPAVLWAQTMTASVPLPDIAAYFLRVGSVLFGSGYVLFPVLEGDLVERLGWVTERQLLDAIAAGQATPGPLFTTATFIGYVLGGLPGAVLATVAIFFPAFVFTALASRVLDRLRGSSYARAFLEGVNGAAVGLIGVTVFSLARSTLTGAVPVAVAVAAAVAVFVVRLNPALVLSAAAVVGLALGLAGG
jgi:chromate transporter